MQSRVLDSRPQDGGGPAVRARFACPTRSVEVVVIWLRESYNSGMKQNLIDQAEFEVGAGYGGNGKVAFSHSWQRIKGGPGGGDGGDGGSVYLVADENMATLKYFTGRDKFKAQDGGHGGINNQHGRNAADLEIRVPVGTMVTIGDEQPRIVDMDTPGQRVLVAKGGKGGRGNKALAHSRNTTPMEAEPGEKGEKFKLKLELKVLADIGLVGMPNVGKSSLLTRLTKARPEIGDYPFTTISPNLGVLELRVTGDEWRANARNPQLETRHLVIADIPGLIEDAHEGRGLGIAFLKHIERCKGIGYIVSPLAENSKAEGLWKQYVMVKDEMKEYSPALLEKPSLVVINKLDLISEDKSAIINYFKKQGVEILLVSALTGEGVEELKQRLVELG